MRAFLASKSSSSYYLYFTSITNDGYSSDGPPYPHLCNADLFPDSLVISLPYCMALVLLPFYVPSDDFLLIFSMSPPLALTFLIHIACGFVLVLVSFLSSA